MVACRFEVIILTGVKILWGLRIVFFFLAAFLLVLTAQTAEANSVCYGTPAKSI